MVIYMDFSWNNIMKQRNSIFGIAAMWVIFFHTYRVLKMPNIIGLSHIFSIGNIGVDIFLFLSAIGLSFSIEKNTIVNFYKNRIKRIIVPWILIALPYFVWFEVLDGFVIQDISSVSLDVSTLSFWFASDFANLATWYISFIVILYAIYPFLYRIYKYNRWYILIILFFVIIFQILFMSDISFFSQLKLPFTRIKISSIFKGWEIVISRIPIFLLGIFFSDYVKCNKQIDKKRLIIQFVLFSIAFFLSFKCIFPYERYMYGIMTIAFVILSGFILSKLKIKWIHRLLNVFGVNSLEVYLIHAVMIRIIQVSNFIYSRYWIVYYIVITGLSIFLSIMCRKLSDKLIYLYKKERQS